MGKEDELSGQEDAFCSWAVHIFKVCSQPELPYSGDMTGDARVKVIQARGDGRCLWAIRESALLFLLVLCLEALQFADEFL